MICKNCLHDESVHNNVLYLKGNKELKLRSCKVEGCNCTEFFNYHGNKIKKEIEEKETKETKEKETEDYEEYLSVKELILKLIDEPMDNQVVVQDLHGNLVKDVIIVSRKNPKWVGVLLA
jgi:hypothetical protein